MTDAYEIGISLALRDGVSESIAAARRDMKAVEAAIGDAHVPLRQLRAIASGVDHAIGARVVAVRPSAVLRAATERLTDGIGNAAAGTPPFSGMAPGNGAATRLPPARRDEPRPRVEPAVTNVPGLNTPDQHPPVPGPAAAGGVSDLLLMRRAFAPEARPDRQSDQRPPPRPEPAGPVPLAPYRVKLGASPAPDRKPSAEPPGGSVPIARSVVTLRSDSQAPRQVIPAGNGALSGPVSGDVLGTYTPQTEPSAPHGARIAPAITPHLRVELTPPEPAIAAPRRQFGQESTTPDLRRATAPDRSMLTTVRPVSDGGRETPEQTGHAPIGGDVYLDGARVGRWLSRLLAREAGRPGSGPTGFDARRSPLRPGSTIGD